MTAPRVTEEQIKSRISEQAGGAALSPTTTGDDQMSLTRRFFLGGALALTAAAALPKLPALAGYPVIHGDGIHDDAEALNALFRGDPVIIEGEAVQIGPDDTASLKGSKHLISDTLHVGFRRDVDMRGCTIVTTDDFRGDFVFRAGPRLHINNIQHNMIDTRGMRRARRRGWSTSSAA